MALIDELIGTRHPCSPYAPGKAQHHFELLREADEFRAAATLYPEEEEALMEQANHRYQAILDQAVTHLELPVAHLEKATVSYRPYVTLTSQHGHGTQAYTSESERPQVAISELSFADIGTLQMLLVHELQHAADFAFHTGLAMDIIERELRARVSVAQSLKGLSLEWPTLYQQSVLDQAYFFLLTYWLPDWDNDRRVPYFDLLEVEAKAKLQAGLYFSPMLLRVLGPELRRAEITIDCGFVYWLERHGEHWQLQQRPLEHDWAGELPEMQTDDGAAEALPTNWHVFASQYAMTPTGAASPSRANPAGQAYGHYSVEAPHDPASDEVLTTLRSFLGQ